jgi:formylglycine-generating enzyme required for sulfatase activity
MKRNLTLLLLGIFTLVVIGVWKSPASNAQTELKGKAPKAGAIVDGPLPGMKFAYIPPGGFLMGSPSNEPDRFDNETQHRVTLTRGYYLMTTEVTQAQWQAVMGSNPSSFKNCGPDCPVERVSWEDSQEFIKRLNQRIGSDNYRLPTEAEWEYAARAGTTTAFSNGGITATGCGHDANLAAMGWYCGNSNKITHPVGRKQANGWGLHDMHGNVSEWCQDWYGDYPKGAVTDPAGPSSGVGRVLRGGCWVNTTESSRSAYRYGLAPGTRSGYIGLRIAGKF